MVVVQVRDVAVVVHQDRVVGVAMGVPTDEHLGPVGVFVIVVLIGMGVLMVVGCRLVAVPMTVGRIERQADTDRGEDDRSDLCPGHGVVQEHPVPRPAGRTAVAAARGSCVHRAPSRAWLHSLAHHRAEQPGPAGRGDQSHRNAQPDHHRHQSRREVGLRSDDAGTDHRRQVWRFPTG